MTINKLLIVLHDDVSLNELKLGELIFLKRGPETKPQYHRPPIIPQKKLILKALGELTKNNDDMNNEDDKVKKLYLITLNNLCF